MADNIYDSFYESIDQTIKSEFDYLCVINFIRKMRTIEIKEKEMYYRILRICYRNGNIIQPIAKRDDANRSEDNDQELKLEGGMKAILRNEENEKMLFLINDTDIKRVDLRFIHLGSIVFNRYIHDFGALEDRFMMMQKKNLEKVYIPMARKFEPELIIGMISSYAYFLSLNRFEKDYLKNLLQARKIMENLQNQSNETQNVYWDFVKNYILGYIYYKFAIYYYHDRRLNIKNSIYFFNTALKELPGLALSLKNMIFDKIKILESFPLKPQ